MIEMKPAEKAKTISWNAADHLHTEEHVTAYLAAVFEDGDAQLIAHALSDVARADETKAIAPQAVWHERFIR